MQIYSDHSEAKIISVAEIHFWPFVTLQISEKLSFFRSLNLLSASVSHSLNMQICSLPASQAPAGFINRVAISLKAQCLHVKPRALLTNKRRLAATSANLAWMENLLRWITSELSAGNQAACPFLACAENKTEVSI